MRWIVRNAAWLIPRFRGSEIQSSFYRAMGKPYRGKLVEFGEFLRIFQKSGRDFVIQQKLANKWKSCVWLGKSDLTDEHLVRTNNGILHAKCTKICREQLVRKKPQSSRRDYTEAKVDDNR